MNSAYFVTDGKYIYRTGVGSSNHIKLDKGKYIINNNDENLPYFINELPEVALTYSDRRKKEYPSIGSQLDMLYHAMKNGEIPVAAEWFNKINEIKNKYPKEIDND
jgi:hypothetical protein